MGKATPCVPHIVCALDMMVSTKPAPGMMARCWMRWSLKYASPEAVHCIATTLLLDDAYVTESKTVLIRNAKAALGPAGKLVESHAKACIA